MTAVPFPDTHFHSVATLRDEHATTFHSSPPCDTRRESATILHSRLRVSYCLLFFISSPPVDLSLDLAVSGFVCVCLSVCSSVSLAFHLKGGCYCRECIGYQGNERESSTLLPPHFQQTFMTILGIYTETHSTLHMLDYSGVATRIWSESLLTVMYIEETFRSTGVVILFKADAASVKSSVGVVKVLKRGQKMKSGTMRRNDLYNLCFLW